VTGAPPALSPRTALFWRQTRDHGGGRLARVCVLFLGGIYRAADVGARRSAVASPISWSVLSTKRPRARKGGLHSCAPRAPPPITGSVCHRRPQSGSLSLRPSPPTQSLVNREPWNAPHAQSALATLLSPPKYFLRRSNNFKFIPNEFRRLVSTNFFNNNNNSVYDLRSSVRRRRARGGTFRFAYSSRPSPVRFIRPEGTIWRPQHSNTLVSLHIVICYCSSLFLE